MYYRSVLEFCGLMDDDLSDSWTSTDSDEYGGSGGMGAFDIVPLELSEIENSSCSNVSDNFSYKIYKPHELFNHTKEIVDEVYQILGLNRSHIRMLLQHYKWDKEKLLERYFESDSKQILRDAHITPFLNDSGIEQESGNDSDSSGNPVKSKRKSAQPGSKFCGICLDTHPIKEMTKLRCGHIFCNNCWRTYFRNEIVEECKSDRIRCPAPNCYVYIEESTISKLVKSKSVLARYQKLSAMSFVENNRLFRWCPGRGCLNAIGVRYSAAMPIKCTCGITSCFQCGRQWHEPIQCSLLSQWLTKCADDSESANWIAANTKDCPGCHFPIEKRGGCNHMTCTNQSCGFEFCWVCLGPWKPHGGNWYQCNIFNESSGQKMNDAIEMSRQALLRYLHYYNRYNNHMNSLKLENKLQRTVLSKMDTLQNSGMSWIEVQFLRAAVEVLLKCRQTLMYTYAFAFYLCKSNQSEVFERNQADLERATEDLSYHLERDFAKNNVPLFKQMVQDKYRYCNQRRIVLIEHVHEGYNCEYWEYRQEIMK